MTTNDARTLQHGDTVYLSNDRDFLLQAGTFHKLAGARIVLWGSVEPVELRYCHKTEHAAWVAIARRAKVHMDYASMQAEEALERHRAAINL